MAPKTRGGLILLAVLLLGALTNAQCDYVTIVVNQTRMVIGWHCPAPIDVNIAGLTAVVRWYNSTHLLIGSQDLFGQGRGVEFEVVPNGTDVVLFSGVIRDGVVYVNASEYANYTIVVFANITGKEVVYLLPPIVPKVEIPPEVATFSWAIPLAIVTALALRGRLGEAGVGFIVAGALGIPLATYLGGTTTHYAVSTSAIVVGALLLVMARRG